MSKGKRRAKAQADKRQRQKRTMVGGGTSKYAIKHAEQARGNLRRTSPFYLPPSMSDVEVTVPSPELREAAARVASRKPPTEEEIIRGGVAFVMGDDAP